jgi:hypothetical protein
MLGPLQSRWLSVFSVQWPGDVLRTHGMPGTRSICSRIYPMGRLLLRDFDCDSPDTSLNAGMHHPLIVVYAVRTLPQTRPCMSPFEESGAGAVSRRSSFNYSVEKLHRSDKGLCTQYFVSCRAMDNPYLHSGQIALQFTTPNLCHRSNSQARLQSLASAIDARLKSCSK